MSDYLLGDGSGIELIEKTVAFDKAVKCVLMSATLNEHVRQIGIAKGATHVIEKPTTIETLNQLLD